jgi:hypothetical protein
VARTGQGARLGERYLIGSQEANQTPLPPKAELQWWYQFYFPTERGRAGYEKNRHDFAKLIWQLASPKWNFSDTTFGLFAGVARATKLKHIEKWSLIQRLNLPGSDSF